MRRLTMRPGVLVALVGALLVGFAAGRTGGGRPAGAAQETPPSAIMTDAVATATRMAELIELEFLRAQVAQPPSPTVCVQPTATATPLPTATPTPVPPVAAGQPLSYAGGWMLTVTAVTLAPMSDDRTATGVFAKVELTITNGEPERRRFPYREFVLRDFQGRPFVPDLPVLAPNEALPLVVFPPSLPSPGVLIFDVAADATGPFVLESTADPTFRVLVEVSQRG